MVKRSKFFCLFYVMLVVVAIFLSGCGLGIKSSPPPMVEDTEEEGFTPNYTSYIDGIGCSHVTKIMLVKQGRDNLGLAIGSFMTARNYQKNRTISATLDQLMGSVNWYCMENPQQSLTSALITIDKDLDKGLLKQAKPSGEKLMLTAVKPASKEPAKKTVKRQVVPAKKRQQVATKAKVKKQANLLPKRDPGGSHVVQVMSTQVLQEAVTFTQTLRKKGLPSYIVSVDLGPKGAWNRVLVGPYSNQEAAEKVARVLGKLKYNAFVRLR
jgi:hypothetical protein